MMIRKMFEKVMLLAGRLPLAITGWMPSWMYQATVSNGLL